MGKELEVVAGLYGDFSCTSEGYRLVAPVWQMTVPNKMSQRLDF